MYVLVSMQMQIVYAYVCVHMQMTQIYARVYANAYAYAGIYTHVPRRLGACIYTHVHVCA